MDEFGAQAAVGKKNIERDKKLPKVFAEVVENYTGGNPQEEAKRWVALKPKELQDRLSAVNYEVSYYMIHQLLDHFGLKKRSYLKGATHKDVPLRNEQFEKIARLKQIFLDAGLPVLSIDTKSKELLGLFHRNGHYFAQRHRLVNDHDFKNQAQGIVVPHGIYDVGDNFGYITLGASKDTSEFVCDNIRNVWQTHLQWKYPDANSVLILCDGGGSNNSRHYIVKQDFYQLAQDLEINIIVAHYPPYCSKYNPIEHRLFCHLHQSWEGAIFQNMDIVCELAQNTSTKTGLEVAVSINNKTYETQRTVREDFKNNLQNLVTFDDQMPQWNYTFLKQNR